LKKPVITNVIKLSNKLPLLLERAGMRRIKLSNILPLLLESNCV
jgi:hypothetical protein